MLDKWSSYRGGRINRFDCKISIYFSNIIQKLTKKNKKQTNIMGNVVEVLPSNQAKNMKKISDEIGKKLETFLALPQTK